MTQEFLGFGLYCSLWVFSRKGAMSPQWEDIYMLFGDVA